MHFLHSERRTLSQLLPGLDDGLAKIPLTATESPGNPALPLFRAHGGPALLIWTAQGGLGATPLQAVQIQRALGSRSPSLAVATTMHLFSVATLLEILAVEPLPALSLLLERIARERLYLA